jgi:high-affinity Fe2+/Pb2+ permease
MLVLAFSLLSVAVLFGAALLMPDTPNRASLSRGTTAAVHGSVAVTGLGIFLSAIATRTSSLAWMAIGLLAVGLIVGVVIFVTRPRRPGPLILALHVVFAGMGYLLLAGLMLG